MLAAIGHRHTISSGQIKASTVRSGNLQDLQLLSVVAFCGTGRHEFRSLEFGMTIFHDPLHRGMLWHTLCIGFARRFTHGSHCQEPVKCGLDLNLFQMDLRSTLDENCDSRVSGASLLAFRTLRAVCIGRSRRNDSPAETDRLLTPPPHEPGVLPRWLHEQGANVIIAGGMGQRAHQLFADSGIEVVVGIASEPPADLVEAYLRGSLASGQNPCDH
jgi:hypothetical protein